jgi:glutamate synthase (NADPH/NADH) large chain
LDTCHVGIATQMETLEEAREKGLKSFVPRVYDEAVARLVTLFTSVGEEVRQLTAALGFSRTQDLVGKAELMAQVEGIGRVDLSELILPVAWEAPAAEVERVPVRQCAPNELNREIAAVAATGKSSIKRAGITAKDRILGTRLAGDLARERVLGSGAPSESGPALIELTDGSVAGNGLAAWSTKDVIIKVRGGAQDGVGKGMLGGRVVILKDQNRYGGWVGGSVGKSFAYGAQDGTFVVQGDADARCGIRLSGADLILGGNLKGPVEDAAGSVGTRANLKGFAFEYMTRGRALVLGDPGPWICSGMTGGVVYVRLQPDLGLDEAAIRKRLAKGAKVHLSRIGTKGKKDLTDLLAAYHEVLLESGQSEQACEVLNLMLECERQFVAIIPVTQQVEASMSTE